MGQNGVSIFRVTWYTLPVERTSPGLPRKTRNERNATHSHSIVRTQTKSSRSQSSTSPSSPPLARYLTVPRSRNKKMKEGIYSTPESERSRRKFSRGARGTARSKRKTIQVLRVPPAPVQLHVAVFTQTAQLAV